MTENLKLWNTLGKTDPKHTKPFNRAGGFKGTAIKPIYTEQKMTEQFGACGVGWGINEPNFTTAAGSDGQVAVYCTVAIWYLDGDKPSAPIYGVGGDMVVVKQSSGLRTDDEAFKKAFTDAVGNAMKHLGMSADVHMGQFDDSKYVQERIEEERESKREAQPAKLLEPTSATSNVRSISERAKADAPKIVAPISPAQGEYIEAFDTKLQFCEALSELDKAWLEEAPNRSRLQIVKDSDAFTALVEAAAKRKEHIVQSVTANLRAG